MTRLDVGVKTDRGLNPDRPVNEDSCHVAHDQIGDRLFTIAVVSDGMGGMDCGQDASQAAVSKLASLRPPEELFRETNPDALADWLADWLIDGVAEANAAVRAALGSANGGCTLTAVAMMDDTFVLGHVGDSRCYLRTGGQVVRISHDHSLVAMLVATGEMTEEEAEVSEDRNAILRSLGSHDNLPRGWIDDLGSRRVIAADDGVTPTRASKLVPGEALILVSDGVWGVVPAAELNGIVLSSAPAQAIADELVRAALRHGAPDNATAVIVRYPLTPGQFAQRRVVLTPNPGRDRLRF